MGWLALVMIYPIIVRFREFEALGSLLWLLGGGISYTLGGIIYGLKWPKFTNKNFGFHEIFHVFVLIGSFCHFWFIIRYVLFLDASHLI